MYRSALGELLQGMLEEDILSQAAVFRDAGHEIPPEDLLCLIPSQLMNAGLTEEIEAIAFDVRVAQQKAEAKRELLLQEDRTRQAEAEKQESKQRRRLCRSTHDKTRQEMHKHYEKPW